MLNWILKKEIQCKAVLQTESALKHFTKISQGKREAQTRDPEIKNLTLYRLS